MYSYISGKVDSLFEGLVVIDNNGIGYNVFVSNNTLGKMPRVGSEVKIYTYTHVKEDAFALYGFLSQDEKAMFLKLINISGVGCKMALQILSGVDATSLAVAIVNHDVTMLSKIKGIGKKTAERIILELKEKVDIKEMEDATMVSYVNDGNVNDAIMALVSLGIGKSEAYKAVVNARNLTDKTEQLITLALRSISK